MRITHTRSGRSIVMAIAATICAAAPLPFAHAAAPSVAEPAQPAPASADATDASPAPGEAGATPGAAPGAGQAGIGEASDGSPVEAPENVLLHDQELRRQLGFRSDLAYIAAVYLDPSRDLTSRDRYDMMLMPSESAEMARRSSVDLLAADIPDQMEAAAPGLYAGSYIDNADGGNFVVQIAGPANRVPDSIAARLRDVPHTFEQVPHSRHALERLRTAFKQRAAEYKAKGFTINGVGTDYDRNGLRLIVSGDLAAARARLKADAGAVPLTVEPGAVDPVGVAKADLPFRGGVIINNNQDGGDCTSGFTGYRNTVPTSYYIITAGHCGLVGHPFGQETFSGQTIGYGFIGSIESSAFYQGSPGDAARIKITDATKKSSQIILGPNWTRQITQQAPVGSYASGSYACLSTTQYMDTDGDYFNCGTIIDGSFDYSANDDYGRSFSTEYARFGNYKCVRGDSGAPAIDYMTAVGIVGARYSTTDNRCIVAHIYDALRATGTHGVWTG